MRSDFLPQAKAPRWSLRRLNTRFDADLKFRNCGVTLMFQAEEPNHD
jgi:hypothetical protein